MCDEGYIQKAILSSLFLLLIGCSPKLHRIAPADVTEELPQDLFTQITAVPQDLSNTHSLKTIRTYFHFFNSEDSTLNYNAEEGQEIAKRLLDAANHRFSTNDKMRLPQGNHTPAYDVRIRYEISNYKNESGIFYHYHDVPEYFIKHGEKANRYDRRMIKKYAISEDSVLNVFIMPFDPEQLTSGEQKIERTAIALGNTIKIPGIFQANRGIEDYAGMFNHEVGHVLGLRHSWNTNDGCEDTPLNDNCWNQLPEPPCQGATSNNLMDYNAFQSAVTPCQIATMHSVLSNPGRPGSRLIRDWCQEMNNEHIAVDTIIRWSLPKITRGDIIINDGGILYITTVIQMSADTRIIIKKGGTLILEGATFFSACGSNWKGICSHRKGRTYLVGDRNTLSDIDPIDPGAVN